MIHCKHNDNSKLKRPHRHGRISNVDSHYVFEGLSSRVSASSGHSVWGASMRLSSLCLNNDTCRCTKPTSTTLHYPIPLDMQWFLEAMAEIVALLRRASQFPPFVPKSISQVWWWLVLWQHEKENREPQDLRCGSRYKSPRINYYLQYNSLIRDLCILGQAMFSRANQLYTLQSCNNKFVGYVWILALCRHTCRLK